VSLSAGCPGRLHPPDRLLPRGALVLLALLWAWGLQNCQAQPAPSASAGVTFTTQDVWSDGTINSFTDITRFDGNWYVVFRTDSEHGTPAPGIAPGDIRVLESANGQTWTTAALISGSGDLRDPKISVTPNNQLMIIAGDTSQYGLNPVQSAAWFSSNGSNWGSENPIGQYDYWNWRTVWYNGTGYGISYGATTGPLADITTRLSTTTNGLTYTPSVLTLSSTDQLADETGMTFLPNGTAIILTRRDYEPSATIGVATGDYTNWTFTNTNLRVDSPDLMTLPDGRILCAARFFTGNTSGDEYTGLSWVDPKTGTVTPFFAFPYAPSTSSDTGYPGLYWYKNQLWVSYYSNVSGPTDIYVAQVSIPKASWSATSGSWGTASNWGGAAPGAIGAAVAIAAPTNTRQTVTLDSPETVGSLQLGNTANTGLGYMLRGSGTNSLTFNNSGNGATIADTNGTHYISAPVVLADNLVVTGSGTLVFGNSSTITENNGSHSLTMNGLGGTLILSGSGAYTGGTIVSGGDLIVNSVSALAEGSSLTVGIGAIPLFDRGSWTSAAGGSFSTVGNWTGVVPNADGAVAVFNTPIKAPLSITLDSPQTVGALVFGNSASKSTGYTLTGSGTNALFMNNYGNGATITVANGTHDIAAPIVLADDLVVTGSGTIEFTSSSSIAEENGSHSLTLSGGTLILSGSDSYTGGTTVTAGKLILNADSALVEGTNLAVGANLSAFDPAIAVATSELAAGQSASPVPEPGSPALWITGLLSAWRLGRGRKLTRSRCPSPPGCGPSF
jgi:autotransporter-associated beta strand protein